MEAQRTKNPYPLSLQLAHEEVRVHLFKTQINTRKSAMDGSSRFSRFIFLSGDMRWTLHTSFLKHSRQKAGQESGLAIFDTTILIKLGRMYSGSAIWSFSLTKKHDMAALLLNHWWEIGQKMPTNTYVGTWSQNRRSSNSFHAIAWLKTLRPKKCFWGLILGKLSHCLVFGKKLGLYSRSTAMPSEYPYFYVILCMNYLQTPKGTSWLSIYLQLSVISIIGAITLTTTNITWIERFRLRIPQS